MASVGISFLWVILVFGKAPLGSVLETGLKTFEGYFASPGVWSYLHKNVRSCWIRIPFDEEVIWNPEHCIYDMMTQMVAQAFMRHEFSLGLPYFVRCFTAVSRSLFTAHDSSMRVLRVFTNFTEFSTMFHGFFLV